jgi:ribonucleotide monophosphatase NagD (HAD superfamily)
MRPVRAVLVDIDGVLTVSWEPIPGAVAVLEWLREIRMPLALVTNTTSRSRASIAAALQAGGFPVTADDILTAPVIAAGYLRQHYPGARCLLLNAGDISPDLAGITIAGPDDREVDVVLIGGAGPEFSYEALNRAFRRLEAGARLVAMSRGLYWRTAKVVGKPAGAFFATALAHLRAEAADALMVGDDIDNDVLAAQQCGLTGVLVRTGKYSARGHAAAAGSPDHVLDSIAGLPALLRSLGPASHNA